MTLGIDLLARIVRAGDRDLFVRLRREYFVDAELPVYDAINNFFLRFQVLPREDALQAIGIVFGPATAPSEFYLERLRRRVLFAQVSRIIGDINAAVGRRDDSEVMRLVSGMLDELRPLDLRSSPPQVAEVAEQVLQEYNDAHRQTTMRGITFGWPTMDRLTNGAMPADIVTLVGRPGEGKSFALIHMAKAAFLAGKRVLFVSMEMGATQVTRRLLAMTVGLDMGLLHRGRLSTFGVQLLHEAVDVYRTETPFFLLSGDLTGSIDDVAQAVAMTNPDVVYVDSSYLLSPRRKTGLRKFEVLEAVCEELKALALRYRIPFVQTTQFNRSAVKDREGGRGLHNIGYSDAIGQISSVVVSIAPVQDALDSGLREMEIIKNRDGQVGSFRCRLNFSPLSFAEIEEQEGDADDVLDI